MKIALASCSKIQRLKTQPAWRSIEEEQPDHLLLLGDNVYSPNFRWNHKKLKKRYKQQFLEPNFQSLIGNVPYNAIWDDHDFGPNNVKGARVSEKKKLKSRELFHRYMNCSTNLPHVYHSFQLGDIKVIMLDIRYYREKSSRVNATILGSEQENWLNEELDHEHTHTIVCSGSCLTNGSERLDDYDVAYARLVEKLRDRGRVLFLSGDIHANKFVTHDGFFEVISSGVGRPGLNNYGIVNYGSTSVDVKLRGTKARDNTDVRIDLAAWKQI